MTTSLTTPESESAESIAAIIGPTGSGKSHQAAMLIPEFRAAAKAGKPHVPTVYTPRTIWLESDRAGSDTLRAHGVQPQVFDISEPPLASVDLFADVTPSETLAAIKSGRLRYMRKVCKAINEIAAKAAAGEVDYLVIDSITAIAKCVVDAHLADESFSDKFDRYKSYRESNNALNQIAGLLRALPVPQVWLMHVRTTYSVDTTEVKDNAARRPVKHTLEIDINRWVRDSIEPVPSLILGAKASMENNKMVHSLILEPDGDYPCKNRWTLQTSKLKNPSLGDVWACIAASQHVSEVPAAPEPPKAA